MADVLVYTRAQRIAKYKRDYLLRVPTADVGTNTQPDIDAGLLAEQFLILDNDAIVIGRSTNIDDAAGDALDRNFGDPEGVPRLGPVGASGFVVIAAAAGGTTIFAGDELTYAPTGARYQCTRTDLYDDGENCPIAGIDTGPSTDLDAETVLTWVSPRPGCENTCTVYERSDGTGLVGGRDEENDDDYRARIKQRRANPPASGNTAAYIEAIEAYPDIGIQKAFTWPCITGPGTTAITFTLRPDTPGASRLPDAGQLALVKAALRTTFPADDGIYSVQLIAQDVAIVLSVTWRKRAKGWTDSIQWPEYSATDLVTVAALPAPTATAFRLETTDGAIPDPQVGQTIAFYDSAAQVFRNKRIGDTTTGGSPWDITVDTTNNVSDISFTPTVGAAPSPWSDSLTLLIEPVVTYFDTLGPGEMVATFSDPGVRQRRQPENPEAYPSEVSNRLIAGVLEVTALNDAEITEPATLPLSSTVGTPGVSAYLLRLDDLVVFPQ